MCGVRCQLLIRCQFPGSTRKKLALAANASALSVYTHDAQSVHLISRA